MKQITIYINDCVRWSGGLNILIQAITALKNNELIDMNILYVKPNLFSKLLNILRLLLRGGNFKENQLIGEDLLNKFYDYVKKNNLVVEEITYKEFKKSKVNNFIFPVMKINNSLKKRT